MKTVTLTVLGKDIETSEYTNYLDCAVTRAIKRAGIEAHDGVDGIYMDDTPDFATRKRIGHIERPIYDHIIGMYKSLGFYKFSKEIESVPIADYSFDVELDID